LGTGQHRDAGFAHHAARFGLVAHLLDNGRFRADKGESDLLAYLGQHRVLGEEAVARMDRVTAGDHGGADHGRHVVVRARCRGRPDADGLVGEADGQRVAIDIAVGDDGGNVEIAAGAKDAQRDFPSIGDQDLAKHAIASRRRRDECAQWYQ
jgi:hypothetical protein